MGEKSRSPLWLAWCSLLAALQSPSFKLETGRSGRPAERRMSMQINCDLGVLKCLAPIGRLGRLALEGRNGVDIENCGHSGEVDF